MLNTPYDARTFNQACIKTGGSRKRRDKRRDKRRKSHRTRGGAPVAFDAGHFSPLTKVSEVESRYDFDGTRKGLPVKFGGSRKRRHGKKHRKTHRK